MRIETKYIKIKCNHLGRLHKKIKCNQRYRITKKNKNEIYLMKNKCLGLKLQLHSKDEYGIFIMIKNIKPYFLKFGMFSYYVPCVKSK